MFNLDNIANVNNKAHSKKWPFIPDHPYRVMIIGGFGSGKTNALLNLIKEQVDIDKIYLYAKDLSKLTHGFLIKKLEDAGTKQLNDPNAFIACSNTMDDIYENTTQTVVDYNSNRKRKVLIVFDDMIAKIMSNKKFQAVVNEFFIRCRKFNISFVFISQFDFSISKDVRLNSTRYLIMKINSKRDLQNIAINH